MYLYSNFRYVWHNRMGYRGHTFVMCAASTAYKFYEKDHIPDDVKINEDVENLLDAYSSFLSTRRATRSEIGSFRLVLNITTSLEPSKL
jgi:hypothetical protein